MLLNGIFGTAHPCENPFLHRSLKGLFTSFSLLDPILFARYYSFPLSRGKGLLLSCVLSSMAEIMVARGSTVNEVSLIFELPNFNECQAISMSLDPKVKSNPRSRVLRGFPLSPSLKLVYFGISVTIINSVLKLPFTHPFPPTPFLEK